MNIAFYERGDYMLEIAKEFKIITNVENDEMLSDFLEYHKVIIEQEHYHHISDVYATFVDDDAMMIVLDCRVRIDKFNDLVEELKNLFKDQRAIIAY